MRQPLGALMLSANRPADAEAAYRADLKIYPENGWSLAGLAKALRSAKRDEEAAEVEARFKKAWANAEISTVLSLPVGQDICLTRADPTRFMSGKCLTYPTNLTTNNDPPMSKPLNIGMIGYGFMGRAHSNAYRQVNQFFQREYRPVLKACCARKEDKIKAFAENWGYESFETDWRKLIERKDIDLIDVCSPNNTHHEIVLAAAEAGKMILCEKPLAMNVAEAEEMVRRRREGRRGQHGLVQLPPRAGHLAGQAAGRRRPHRPAVPLSGHLPAGLDHRRRRAAGRRGAVAARRRRGRLGRDRRPAGPLDRHGRVAQRPDRSASTAATETFVKERMHAETGKMEPVTIDDACMFLAVFANGSMGTFESTRYARGRKNYNTFELNGEAGSVFFDLEDPQYLAVLPVRRSEDRQEDRRAT